MNDFNTGIYIRVSTEEQVKEGFSIRAQEEKLTNYAINIKGWNVYKVYSDCGISGKKINNRPGIISLLNDIKDKKVNNVLIYKIDRITRSTKDLIELVDYFNYYNCNFNSLTESIDTTSATGRMFIKIIGTFAEFERENIVERIKVGLERKVKEGYSLCSSNVSYGYDRRKNNKIQIINYEEAKIVKKIFKIFLQEKKISVIVKYLNNLQIKTKKNKKWTYKSVKSILTNPNYIGLVRYGINTTKYFETIGKHKPIIKKSTYKKVHDLLVNKQRYNIDAYYTSLIYCFCGHKMSPKRRYYKNKCYIYYVCSYQKCVGISHRNLDKFFSLTNKMWKRYSDEYKHRYLVNKINKIIVFDNKENITLQYKT